MMLLRGLASPAKLQRLSGRPLDQDIFCARASFMHMLPRLVWTIPVVLLHYGSLGTAQQRARALRRTSPGSWTGPPEDETSLKLGTG